MKLSHTLSARTLRGISLVAAASLILLNGCVVDDPSITGQFDVGGITTGVASAQDENPGAANGNPRPPRNNIQDGASNTIAVGESGALPTDGSVRPIVAVPGRGTGDPSNTADGGANQTPPNDPASAPADNAPGGAPNSGAPNSGGGSTSAASEAADEAALESQFANNRFEFGSSSFFSGGSITENSDLTLCNGRRFGMLVTRITSTQFNTFSSESQLIGEWSIDITPQGTDLILNVRSASDPADVGTRRLPLTANDTTLFIAGNAARIADATNACR
ncbi:MAG: DUF1559 domain-containing protein [Phycisphaerales bacterium]|nr:DUF1559 domain-containing protein [Phycisphaerales bacterium]